LGFVTVFLQLKNNPRLLFNLFAFSDSKATEIFT